MKSRFGETPKPTREIRAGLAFARYPDGCFGEAPKSELATGESSTGLALLKQREGSAKLKTNDRASSWPYQMRTRSFGLR